MNLQQRVVKNYHRAKSMIWIDSLKVAEARFENVGGHLWFQLKMETCEFIPVSSVIFIPTNWDDSTRKWKLEQTVPKYLKLQDDIENSIIKSSNFWIHPEVWTQQNLLKQNLREHSASAQSAADYRQIWGWTMCLDALGYDGACQWQQRLLMVRKLCPERPKDRPSEPVSFASIKDFLSKAFGVPWSKTKHNAILEKAIFQ